MGSPLLDPRARQEDDATRLALGLLRLEQALAEARGAAAAADEISPLQLQLLFDLSTAGTEPATAGELARRHRLSAATVSVSLAGLVRRRLVQRRADARDARRRSLSLSAAGERLAQRAAQRLDGLLGLARSLAEGERRASLAAVVGLVARAAEAGWIRPERMCVACRFFERERDPRSPAPHWCRLMERPLAAFELRLDCPEHEPITPSSP
jgi:DNA-binding MarR family transcriptional regulator